MTVDEGRSVDRQVNRQEQAELQGKDALQLSLTFLFFRCILHIAPRPR